jgi:serine/threonine-protein kinase RsbW
MVPNDDHGAPIRHYQIERRAESLAGLQSELADYLQAHGVAADSRNAAHICCDEIIANAIHHENTVADPIAIAVCVSAHAIQLRIVYRARPFEPVRVRRPDVSTPVSQRDIGGLGLHLVQELTRHCHYQRTYDQHRFELEIARSE